MPGATGGEVGGEPVQRPLQLARAVGGGVGGDELADFLVGGGVGRLAGVREQLGELVRQRRHLAGLQPLVPGTVHIAGVPGRRNDDDAVLPADLAPALPEPAGAVADHPARWLREHVVPAAGLVGPAGLVRRRGPAEQVRGEDVRQFVRVVDVEHHRARPADVQRQQVVRAREPRRELLRVAAGLVLPPLAHHRARVLPGVGPHRQAVPASRGVPERCGEHVVVRDQRDGQHHVAPRR